MCVCEWIIGKIMNENRNHTINEIEQKKISEISTTMTEQQQQKTSH